MHSALQPLLEIHADPLYPQELKPLSQPFQLFEFQLADPPLRNQRMTVPAHITQPGTAHAILVWWQSSIDQQGLEMISTAPCWVSTVSDGADGCVGGLGQEWRDHWKQCWAPVGPAGLQVI